MLILTGSCTITFFLLWKSTNIVWGHSLNELHPFWTCFTIVEFITSEFSTCVLHLIGLLWTNVLMIDKDKCFPFPSHENKTTWSISLVSMMQSFHPRLASNSRTLQFLLSTFTNLTIKLLICSMSCIVSGSRGDRSNVMLITRSLLGRLE